MRFVAFLFSLMLLALPALADTQGLPYVLTTQPENCPGACTVSTGGTAVVAINADDSIKMFCLSNPATATEPIYFGFGVETPTTTGSFLSISAGGSECFGGALIWQGIVSVNAASNSHVFGVEVFR